MAEIVAMQECAEGNGEVGSMWVETAIFDETARLEDVLAWAEQFRRAGGRLMLSRPTKDPSHD